MVSSSCMSTPELERLALVIFAHLHALHRRSKKYGSELASVDKAVPCEEIGGELLVLFNERHPSPTNFEK